MCDPETLGCWSSFSAWFKAMTLSPRAKATKALQARMEHLDMRGHSLINSGLDTVAERWQGCWREQRVNKDKSASRRSLTSGFQSPASSAETTELRTGFYQPPATSHYGEKQTIRTDYLVHTRASLYWSLIVINNINDKYLQMSLLSLLLSTLPGWLELLDPGSALRSCCWCSGNNSRAFLRQMAANSILATGMAADWPSLSKQKRQDYKKKKKV